LLQTKDCLAAWKAIACWCVALVIAYIPLWRILWSQSGRSVKLSGPLVTKLAYFGYTWYCLLMGESIAPWAGALGLVRVGVAFVALTAAAFQKSPVGRNFYLAGLAILLIMAIGGFAVSKRLLIVAPWFLLGLSSALSSFHGIRRGIMIGALSVVVVAGWYGIVTQRYYAATHAIEPWRRYADQSAEKARNAWLILGNNPSFSFYLSFEIPESDPRIRWVTDDRNTWAASDRVQFVEGVNRDFESQSAAVLDWLRQNCTPTSETRDMEDPGSLLKKRLFPDAGQQQYRIVVREFVCAPN